jgi:aquaporin related protein
MLGAILASGFYKFIKVLEYETVNPGQDAMEDPGHDAGFGNAHTTTNGQATRGVGGAEFSVGGADHATAEKDYGAGPNTGIGTDGYGAGPDAGSNAMRPRATQRISEHGTMAGLANGAHARPAPVSRLASSRQRTDSPGMGSTDDAFHGLSTGMHGVERRGSSRVIEKEELRGEV